MTKTKSITWAAVSLCLAGILAACASDKKDSPSITVPDAGEGGTASGGATSKGGTSSTGGSVSAGGSTTGTAGTTSMATGGSGTAGATNVAGSTSVAGAAGAATDCEDSTKSCYNCSATTNDQILRHCTDAVCIPFDNKTLTKLVNGQLPALP